MTTECHLFEASCEKERPRRDNRKVTAIMQIEQCLVMPCSEYPIGEDRRILKSDRVTEKVERGWQTSFKTSSLTKHLKSLKETSVAQTFIKKSKFQRNEEGQQEHCTSNDGTEENLNFDILSVETQEIPLLAENNSQTNLKEIVNSRSPKMAKNDPDNDTYKQSNSINNCPTNAEAMDWNQSGPGNLPGNCCPKSLQNGLQDSTTTKEKRAWFKRSKSHSPTRLLTLPRRSTDSLRRRKTKDSKSSPNKRSNSLRDFKRRSENKFRRNDWEESCLGLAEKCSQQDPIEKESSEESRVNVKNCPKIINRNSESSKEWKTCDRYPLGLMKAKTKLSVLPR